MTSLRFLAALFVFISHFPILLPNVAVPENIVMTFCANGYVGVTIFFILSGFILTYTYAGREDFFSATGIRNFYISRFARIYPMYFLALTLTIIVALKNGILPNGWYFHYFALQAWSPSNEFAFNLNGPAWSVGVEAFLYLIFPLLLYITRKSSKSTKKLVVQFFLAAGFIFISFAAFKYTSLNLIPTGEPNSAHRWLYRSPIFRVGDFLLGIIAARLYINYSKTKLKIGVLSAIKNGSLLVIFLLMFQESIFMKAESFDLLYSIPITLLILSLALGEPFNRWKLIQSKIMQRLGELSFSFFLIQSPVGLTGLFSSFLRKNDQSPTDLMDMFRYSIGLSGLIIISWLLFNFVEKPCRRILTKNLNSRKNSTDV